MKNKDLDFLTIEEEKYIREFYDGKLIKCLIMPYHNKEEIEEYLKDYKNNKEILPEGNISYTETISFVKDFVENSKEDELLIVTNSYNILLDMLDINVRYVYKNGELTNIYDKPFIANIHSIQLGIYKNVFSEMTSKSFGRCKLDIVISSINELKDSDSTIDNDTYEKYKNVIENVGEDLIRNKLSQMLRDIPRESSTSNFEDDIDKRIAKLEAEKKRLLNKKR